MLPGSQERTSAAPSDVGPRGPAADAAGEPLTAARRLDTRDETARTRPITPRRLCIRAVMYSAEFLQCGKRLE